MCLISLCLQLRAVSARAVHERKLVQMRSMSRWAGRHRRVGGERFGANVQRPARELGARVRGTTARTHDRLHRGGLFPLTALVGALRRTRGLLAVPAGPPA